ncbi:MAG TPA: AI-2E family transporter [Acetobacteraceae bacterium]|jgi:predicted PurR-regulated permease PerM|nr:AI-2E family transporter [Acetobacteraceae bacterium]HUB50455.1 AI-2E family transporter [Acetobacteraceae bacterium]
MPDSYGAEHVAEETFSLAATLQIIAVAAGFILLVWLLSDIILLIFMAVLIAVILRGISHWVARCTHVPEAAVLALVCVVVPALLLGFFYYIGPRLANESQDLYKQVHQQIDHLHDSYGNTPWGKSIFQWSSPTGAVQNHVVTYARTVATSTIGGLASALILIVTALYFAIAPGLYLRGLVILFPLKRRPRAHHVLLKIGSTLQWWSLGQLIDMVVVGVLTGLGLAILGVPLALALGVLAGLFTFVPYFGAIAAAVPAMLVGLTINWQTALWVLLIFLIVHSVEGYVVSPLVQRRTVHLPPALSILSMTILGTIFGPLGVILGTPAAAALMVAVREAYVGGVLGDPEVLDEA